jgi:hypothetical protein
MYVCKAICKRGWIIQLQSRECYPYTHNPALLLSVPFRCWEQVPFCSDVIVAVSFTFATIRSSVRRVSFLSYKVVDALAAMTEMLICSERITRTLQTNRAVCKTKPWDLNVSVHGVASFRRLIPHLRNTTVYGEINEDFFVSGSCCNK